MKNFKNDALTTAEQNNVEGGLHCITGLVKAIVKLPFKLLFGHCGCNPGCGSKSYCGW